MVDAAAALVGALVGALGVALSVSAYPVPDDYEIADPVPREIPVRTIDPAALARGSDAAVDHLQDGVIHTAEGKTVRVEVPYADERQALLGRSGGGWLVASWRADRAQVSRIRRGRAPAVVPKTRIEYWEDEFNSWRASRDGAWLLQTNFNRGGGSMGVYDVATGKLVYGTESPFLTPADADAGHVITFLRPEFSRDTEMVDVVPPDETRVVAGNAWWASIRDNLVFVGSRKGQGPTRLDKPGVPKWTANFRPLDISPNGRLVIGRGAPDDAGSPVLELRRLADGAVLQAIAFPPKASETAIIEDPNEQTARFEDNRRFVFQSNAGSRAVLVRCRLSGRCDRASECGGNISVPYEYFLW